jgi:ribosomal protein S18 acetylase RimI-like enzyme
MVFDAAAAPVGHVESGAVAAQILGPHDPRLATAIAAAHLAFDHPGTAIGTVGTVELEAKAAELSVDGWLQALAERIAAGRTVVAAAFDPAAPDVPLSSGQHNPIDAVSEIVGVGTLPSVRRRGLAHAVTAALVDDARERGVETIFLSAGDEEVARIYARAGFRRVGTALVAEPPG